MDARVIKNDIISYLHELSNVTTSYELNFAFFRYLGPIIIAGIRKKRHGFTCFISTALTRKHLFAWNAYEV